MIDKKVQETLKEYGAVFVRHHKHYIYRLPNGKIISVPSTPSCPFTSRKQIAIIKRLSL